MSVRKGAAIFVATALLACSNLILAAEPQQDATQPLYLADTKPADTSIMGFLDKAGASKSLSDNGITIGGWVEAGWTWNCNNPATKLNYGRVFDFEDQDLTLNQVVIFVDKSVDTTKKTFQIGGRMEWMWGGDARVIHSNGLFDHYGVNDGPDEQFDLTQAYVDLLFPIGNGLKVRVGKFVTTHGYETINPNTNSFYSHSYLFGYAIPFTHTGVLLTYQFSDAFTLTAGVTRGWEQSLEDNNGSIDFLASAALTLSKQLSAVVNVSAGPQRTHNSRDYRLLVDLCLTYKMSDQITLGFNGDLGWERDADIDGSDAHWYGVAGYLTYTFNDTVALNARAEWFADPDGARGLGVTGSIYEVTLGLDIKPFNSNKNLAGLRIRPEVRWDYATDAFFDGGTEHHQFTFGVDAIFNF